MSTKIYNAYKYLGEDIKSLLEELRVMKEWHTEWKIDKVLSLFRDEVGMDALWDVISIFDTGKFSRLIDPKDCVMVFPHESDLYVKFFCEEKLIEDMLTDNFVDFHYQDSTDRPEGISEEEYAERERIWDEISVNHYFTENGFSYNLLEPYWQGIIIERLVKQELVKVKEYNPEAHNEEG